MEDLNALAFRIGDAACQHLWRNGYLTSQRILCGDGTVAAGWKLLTVAMVLLGLATAWAFLGRAMWRSR